MASNIEDNLNTFFDNIQSYLFGGTSQVASDYTSGQQELANTAWTNGLHVLSGLSTDLSSLTSDYQSYLDSLSSVDLYSQATSEEAMAGYASTIDSILSDYSSSLLSQAKTEGQEAAAQAAEDYNLAGVGGLYSGAAAKAVAKGAAEPITKAYTTIAEKQADLYSSLIGTNISSLSSILGYQVEGESTLYNTGASTLTTQATALANLYGAQASSYDTEAVFENSDGYISNLLQYVPLLALI